MLLTKICETCGNEYQVRPSVADLRMNCSKKCYAEARKKRVSLVCIVCGKTFERAQWEAAQSRNPCCSWECHSKRVIKTCPICGKEFGVKRSHAESRVYCSRECAAIANSGEHNAMYVHGLSQTSEYTQYHYKLRKRRIKNQTPEGKKHTRKDWLKLLASYHNRCFYCRCEMTTKMGPQKATRDHIVPIAKGGSDEISNILPACWTCNEARKTKDFWEFMVIVTSR